MTRYTLARQADRDLLDLFRYGVETHGLAQAERYRDGLRDCFELIARHPRIGRASPWFGEKIRRHEHGSHVLLYEAETDGVLIVAILHRRSVPRPLADPD